MTSDALRSVAAMWRLERAERLARRHLDPADFTQLRAAGLLDLSLPVESGGAWRDRQSSVRPIADALRLLGAADPSPALVSAMHPAVLSFWLANEAPGHGAWEAQRAAVFATAAGGAQWGTLTSEPGSGGDIMRTRSTAVPFDGLDDVVVPGRRYLVSGDKHFGSGTGICSYMFTTAIPDGESEPAAFFLDTRALVAGHPCGGFTVTKPWDGAGMSATQSHAVRLERCGAVRLEWPLPMAALAAGAGAVNLSLFIGVIVGVLDEAVAVATERLRPHADAMRAYERVEWARVTTDYWLVEQAYEGVLRAVELGGAPDALRAALRGKAAVAELSEQIMVRLGRVVGGATYSESSPFASWFEDVRALGFLRPPWGLMFDNLFANSFV